MDATPRNLQQYVAFEEVNILDRNEADVRTRAIARLIGPYIVIETFIIILPHIRLP